MFSIVSVGWIEEMDQVSTGVIKMVDINEKIMKATAQCKQEILKASTIAFAGDMDSIA